MKLPERKSRLQELFTLTITFGKESACNAGDLSSIPGLERSPGEGKGYPLQYSGLENSMDCIVHGVTKSQTRLSNFHFTNLLTSSNRYRKCLAKTNDNLEFFFFYPVNWSFKSEIKFKIHLDEGNFLPTNKQNQALEVATALAHREVKGCRENVLVLKTVATNSCPTCQAPSYFILQCPYHGSSQST